MHTRGISNELANTPKRQKLSLKNRDHKTGHLFTISPFGQPSRNSYQDDSINHRMPSYNGKNSLSNRSKSSQERYKDQESVMRESEVNSEKDYFNKFFDVEPAELLFDIPHRSSGINSANFGQSENINIEPEMEQQESDIDKGQSQIDSQQDYVAPNPTERQRLIKERRDKEAKDGRLFFTDRSSKMAYGKLFWFKPNSKNGRYLMYNRREMKFMTIYKCLGCNKPFKVPSALGGHLSRCTKKAQHLARLENRDTINKSERQIIKKEQGIKEQVQEENAPSQNSFFDDNASQSFHPKYEEVRYVRKVSKKRIVKQRRIARDQKIKKLKRRLNRLKLLSAYNNALSKRQSSK